MNIKNAFNDTFVVMKGSL